jgi:hypothetical protein
VRKENKNAKAKLCGGQGLGYYFSKLTYYARFPAPNPVLPQFPSRKLKAIRQISPQKPCQKAAPMTSAREGHSCSWDKNGLIGGHAGR